MKAINIGDTFDIYTDTVKVYEKLPAKNYVVRFDKMSGFYLENYPDIKIKEKIYGVHDQKVNKVLKSFNTFQKNLGVILSGDKGIGKSLFAKRLAMKAVENGIPVIIVDKFIPGIASYIEKIDQEVMILFDEFDKTFGGVKTQEGEADPQAGLLSLFDGVSQGKKLFVVTCNELRNLNDYLINRPGRFHYHFRFEYPTVEEIREYLKDKLDKKYYDEINKVVEFSRKVNLNYDCLRSIAFELNTGEAFEEAIKDLNIININAACFDVTLYCTDGTILLNKGNKIDLFNPDGTETVWFDYDNGYDVIGVEFNVKKCYFDMNSMLNTVKGEDITMKFDNDYPEEILNKAKKLRPSYLTLRRCKSKELHYVV